MSGEKLAEEELADIRDRRRFKPGVDLGTYIDKLLAHVAELEVENANAIEGLGDKLDDLAAANEELRGAASELLDALPKCSHVVCDAPATRWQVRDGRVDLCDEHSGVIELRTQVLTAEHKLAAPAARLRALLGKA